LVSAWLARYEKAVAIVLAVAVLVFLIRRLRRRHNSGIPNTRIPEPD
jgi:hypothetical protein